MRTLLAVALAMVPWVAAAQAPTIVWSGSYLCGQGPTALTLTVRPAPRDDASNAAEALFHFTADPSNPGVPEGCFAMAGTFDARRLRLQAGEWRLQPPDYVTVDLDGAVSPDGQSITGHVSGPGCSDFMLTRVKRDDGVSRCGHPLS